MRKPIIALTQLILLISMASPASASGSGWRSDSVYGSVKVSSDRTHITVCDTGSDATEVWAEYATSYLFTHTVKDERGGDVACGKDSVFLGHITVFKLCYRYNRLDKQCNRSIWIDR